MAKPDLLTTLTLYHANMGFGTEPINQLLSLDIIIQSNRNINRPSTFLSWCGTDRVFLKSGRLMDQESSQTVSKMNDYCAETGFSTFSQVES